MTMIYQTVLGGLLRSDGSFVPSDPHNIDYQAALAWVAAGNTPAPEAVPHKPSMIPAGTFFLRFTPTERIAVQQACVSSPTLGMGLTLGLALGEIDLTGTTLTTWLAGLVSAGAVTSQRATEIATP